MMVVEIEIERLVYSLVRAVRFVGCFLVFGGESVTYGWLSHLIVGLYYYSAGSRLGNDIFLSFRSGTVLARRWKQFVH